MTEAGAELLMVCATTFPIPDMTEAGAEQHFSVDTMIREFNKVCTWKKDFDRGVAVLLKASA